MKILANLMYRHCYNSKLRELYDAIEQVKAVLNCCTFNAYMETHDRFTEDNGRTSELKEVTKASKHISDVLKQLEQCQGEIITVMGNRFISDVMSGKEAENSESKD